jgi:hypothetical protein
VKDLTAKSRHAGLAFGKDKLYGGDGFDIIYGGAGADKIHGGDDDDALYGEGGEDTMWGDDGADFIDGGYGWDTIFGGDGCDTIWVADGGDVIWLGDCDNSDTMTPGTTEEFQKVYIYGTGRDPENWTVIMDFWLEGAKPWNMICPRPSKHQAKPATDACPALADPVNDMCL